MTNIIAEKYYKEIVNESGDIIDLEFNYDNSFNFAYDVVDAIAAKNPLRRALCYRSVSGNVLNFTFEDVRKQSNRIANVLLEKGIKKGDSVMLIMKRHYGFWMAMTAIHKIGAVAIPTSHMVSGKDIYARMVKADVKAVICVSDSYIVKCVNEALEKVESKPFILSVDRENEEREYTSIGEKLYDLMEQESDELKRIPTNVADPMLYYFTSGTSGDPKAVIHDFAYPISHIYTARRWHGVIVDGLHLSVADSGWAKSAWGKMYGQWFCECAIMVYDYDNFYAAEMLKLIAELGVTSFCAPPSIYKYLVREKMSEYNLSKVTQVVTAGEPMPTDIVQKFHDATGLNIREGFGQTETTLLICTPVGKPQTPGSIGKVAPQYEIKVIDEEGNELPAGESGELVIVPNKNDKSRGIFKGYLGNPEKYEEVWKDGIYHTCDKVHIDEEGNVFFEGRVDDVIKSSGYRIGPSEVEDILMLHEAVFECAVTAYPSKTRGSLVKATVVLNKGFEGSTALKTELQDFVKARAAIYKYPRMVEFVEALPKTFNGKINRKKIKEADERKFYNH